MEFWDFGARSRVKGLDNVRGPVTAIDINRAGFLAYAVGYDWQKGVEGIIQVQNKICIGIWETSLCPGKRQLQREVIDVNINIKWKKDIGVK